MSNKDELAEEFDGLLAEKKLYGEKTARYRDSYIMELKGFLGDEIKKDPMKVEVVEKPKVGFFRKLFKLLG